MNPELPAPQFRPENLPPTTETSETLHNPEQAGEQSREREQNMQQVDRQAPPPQTTIVSLPPQVVMLPAPAVKTDDTAGPTIAGDDDLIEKEWVDKAKKIILQTQNDPFRREQEVNKLQVDYLKKRYGKDLGTSN